MVDVLPPSEDRLVRLERMIRYQWIALLVAALAVLGLVALFLTQTAREAARSHAQLQMLQQIQADFGQNEDPTRSVLTDADLHRLLRESVNQVRKTYAPLEQFDLSDPDGNLDALLPRPQGTPELPDNAPPIPESTQSPNIR